MRHRKSFIADQRGAVAKVLTLRGLLADRRGAAAFEFIIIAAFLIFVLLLPIADVAVAALRYMQVRQAMRDLGAFVQYNQPPDLTTWVAATWTNSSCDGGDVHGNDRDWIPNQREPDQYHRLMRDAGKWCGGWSGMHVRRSD